jgi:CheY-like chemotaxis protein
MLIADDDSDVLAATADFFEAAGFEIRKAEHGGVALEHYDRWKPHAVLLDIEMPVMDGRSVATRIRSMADGAVVLLIAISGLSSAAEAALSYAVGFDFHFSKPAHLPDILAIVLERSRLRF